MKAHRIVVCDDEMLIRLWLTEHLAEAGYLTEGAEDGAGLTAALGRESADVVLLDLRLPDVTGLELLERLRTEHPGTQVIMMTGFGEVETAVAAVRAGAFHFLEKPIALPELTLLIAKALEDRALRSTVERLRAGFHWQFAGVMLVGRSAALGEIAAIVTRIAARDKPINVLITGESGTGKGVVAQAVHAQGSRHSQPFLSVNCSALPEHLLESEMFGHEAGAYTDAKLAKRGLVELADKGTLFLDEIGDMPRSLQAHLLEFLETHRFRRVGGTKLLEVDVHVIAATNRDLETAVAQGDFREDLFFRLNVVPIHIPPLRERPDDVLPLATHFLDGLSLDLGRPSRQLSTEALAAMEHYPWPGNAREMRNMLERILLLEDGEVIDLGQLPGPVAGQLPTGPDHFVLPGAGIDLEALERELLCQAMKRSGGNKTGAARLLGLSRDTLRYRLEKYGIH